MRIIAAILLSASSAPPRRTPISFSLIPRVTPLRGSTLGYDSFAHPGSQIPRATSLGVARRAKTDARRLHCSAQQSNFTKRQLNFTIAHSTARDSGQSRSCASMNLVEPSAQSRCEQRSQSRFFLPLTAPPHTLYLAPRTSYLVPLTSLLPFTLTSRNRCTLRFCWALAHFGANMKLPEGSRLEPSPIKKNHI